MRLVVVIVGYGVQGKKRLRVAGSDAVGVVDPVYPQADFRDIRDVPLERYDAAVLCVPDEPKVEILRHLLANGKHALVEKPLHAAAENELRELEKLARGTGALCYTAYNHRFEPHYVRMRDLSRSGELGQHLSLPHVLRQRHRAAGARIGLARPGRRRAARSRLASARHRAVLVRRRRPTTLK